MLLARYMIWEMFRPLCLSGFVQSKQTSYLFKLYDPCLLQQNTDIGDIYYKF